MLKNWTEQQINAFAKADDMYISPFYEDGQTPGTLTWIWSVVVDKELYVRAYNGKRSKWYQSAVKQRAGKIQLNGQEYAVIFGPVDGDMVLTEKINRAYQEKYAASRYLAPMLGQGPVSATVKILPR